MAFPRPRFTAPAPRPPEVRERAREIHRRAIVADFHVDSILWQRLVRYDLRRRHRPIGWGTPFGNHADIPRMLAGGYTCPGFGLHYWPWGIAKAWAEVRRQIDYFERLTQLDERITIARTAEDVRRAKAEGRLAGFPGCEGAHILDGRLERIAELRRRNVRYLTLTHFSKNAAATSAMGIGADAVSGLTPWGRELVAECNRVGLIVDVAHVNAPGVLDACAASRRPVIASHTGVKGVRPHRRNIDDAGLRAIAAGGGVVGIMFAPVFLAASNDADSTCILDHIDHAVRTIGIDHVALGSDFDGMIPIPTDLRDCTDLVRVTEGLVLRGYSELDIRKILGENWLRVLARFDEGAV